MSADLMARDGTEAGDGWLDTYLPYRMYRVTNRLNMRLQNRLRAIDINTSRWRVLSVLKSYGKLSISKIVEHTLMEQPTVSRVVTQLEQEGRVLRRSSAEDSRVTDVVLTRAGVEAFNEIVPAARRHQEMALMGLSRQDIDNLQTILARIERNIDLYE